MMVTALPCVAVEQAQQVLEKEDTDLVVTDVRLQDHSMGSN
jgi:hypothetical protein